MRPSYDYSSWPEAFEAPGLTLLEFSDLVLQVFETVFAGVQVRCLDGTSYNLALPEKGSVTFDLANVWALCREQPGRRREVLAAFAGAMVAAINAAFDPEAVDPALLIPVLRPTREDTDSQPLSEKNKDKAIAADSDSSERREAADTLVPIRPFAGDLSIFIAQDEPKSIRYLFPDDIESLEMPEPELFELAQSNLVRILNGHGVTIEPREGGIYNVTAGGDLESSLLLRGPFWKTIKEKLKLTGRIVAAAPVRGSLLFVDGDNAEHVYELRRVARSVYETGPHPLSAQLFGRYGDGWIAE